jgi:hypothetical protein
MPTRQGGKIQAVTIKGDFGGIKLQGIWFNGSALCADMLKKFKKGDYIVFDYKIGSNGYRQITQIFLEMQEPPLNLNKGISRDDEIIYMVCLKLANHHVATSCQQSIIEWKYRVSATLKGADEYFNAIKKRLQE